MSRVIVKSTAVGLLGIFLLSSIYFILLTWIGQDWRHPLEQFLAVKYWMGTLFLGFGIQMGLFWYVRSMFREKQARRVAATSGGVSTATMIACCAHHITDLVPILGLSALSIFLARYQVYILMIAIVFNAAGIFFLLNMIKKHRLYNLNPREA